MTTPVFLTGFGPGVLSANGGGLVTTIAGSPTVQSTTKRTGTYALQCNPSSATCYVDWALSGSPTVIVGTVYIRFAAYPSSNACTLFKADAASGADLGLNYDTVNNKFYARFIGLANGNSANVVISLDTWYRIDFKFDISANPKTIDFAVNGTAAAQSTYAQAAATFSAFGFGQYDSVTVNEFFDDFILSVTSGDYPIGAEQVDALLPNADGTHNNAANTIEDDAGNDIDGSAHYAYDHINQQPMSESTLYLKQSSAEATKYAEVAFADVGNYTTYHGVMAVLAYKSSGTNANEGACIIIDEDSTATTVWGSPASRADYSESSMFYKSAILPAPAGGLDKAAIDAIKARLGYSNDVADVPYWENLMLEVAHNATAPAGGGPRHMMYYKRMRGSV